MGEIRIITETGEAKHGVATANGLSLMNVGGVVYMGATDVKRQHMNVERMKMLGATVVPGISGNMTLKMLQMRLLEIGAAIRETPLHHRLHGRSCIRIPIWLPGCNLLQAEIRSQLMEQEGQDYPDMLIACVGGEV